MGIYDTFALIKQHVGRQERVARAAICWYMSIKLTLQIMWFSYSLVDHHPLYIILCFASDITHWSTMLMSPVEDVGTQDDFKNSSQNASLHHSHQGTCHCHLNQSNILQTDRSKAGEQWFIWN